MLFNSAVVIGFINKLNIVIAFIFYLWTHPISTLQTAAWAGSSSVVGEHCHRAAPWWSKQSTIVFYKLPSGDQNNNCIKCL